MNISWEPGHWYLRTDKVTEYQFFYWNQCSCRAKWPRISLIPKKKESVTMVTQLALAFLLAEINFFKTIINSSANERRGLAKVGSNLKASETKFLSSRKWRYYKIMWLFYRKGRKSWNTIGEIILSQQTEIAYKMLNLIKHVNGGWGEKLIQG